MRPSLVAHPGLLIENWQTPCKQGVAYACRGLWHTLEKGCALNRDEHCIELATRLADPEALNRDLNRAISILSESCQRGYKKSCGQLSDVVAIQQPLPTSQQAPSPAPLLSDDCRQGDAQACIREASLLITEGGDSALIRARFERACELNEAAGCVNLGLMYLQGRAGPPNPNEARRLHIKACDLGLAKACGRLAVLYARGIGGPPSIEMAREASQKACRGGDEVSCLASQP